MNETSNKSNEMLNTIVCGDCLEVLKTLDAGSVDLTVTSPPYNVDLGNNKYHKTPYSLYQDNKEHGVYVRWLEDVFREVLIRTANGGRCCINIGDGKNGAVPTSSDVTHFMTRMGWIPFTHIIWDKSQVGNRTSWGSYLSPSCPSFPTPFEHIVVFAKGEKSLQHAGQTDLTKQEFIDWSLALWRFPPNHRQKETGHPAMFPVELPTRCIKMLTWVGDLVLDPFCGSGTTCIAAKRLKRHYIGIDISEEYCNIARIRLSGTPIINFMFSE